MRKRIIAIMLIACMTLAVTACSPSKEAAVSEGTEETTKTGETTETVQHPVVTITMQDGGVIKAELYPEVAPNTVNNFISLINKGYYNGTIFHRVIQGFMIQGGSPSGTGSGDPGYSIRGEFTENGFQNDLKHTRGVLSMARRNDPDSAGSQFFIMHGDADWLDGQYAAFGMVIEGMDVVDRIAGVQTDSNDRPLEDQVVKTITAETLGVNYPEPETR